MTPIYVCVLMTIWGGTPKTPELFLEGGPLVVQSSPARWVFCVLGTHLYQCTSWLCCERLHSASGNFFLRQHFCPFHHGVIYHRTCPHPTECSAVFDKKTARPPCPTPSIHLLSPWATCFCFPGWKSPQRETFCKCGRGETKMAEALKGITIDKLKYCFEQ